MHTYNEKPERETDFSFLDYYREIKCCTQCGHFISRTPLDLSAMYRSDYVDRTYGGIKEIQRKFHQIMSLSPKRSDNFGRVEKIVEYAKTHFTSVSNLNILDVGGGLGVFLALIRKKTDWNCTSIEPDGRLTEHINKDLGIESLTSDYRTLRWDRKFDIICMNKVLEHIEEPLDFLEKAKDDLKPNGFIYLELPDGEKACLDPIGFEREEFFIEHHHAFSMKSMKLLSQNAGLETAIAERLCEPSSKYTIRAFLSQ